MMLHHFSITMVLVAAAASSIGGCSRGDDARRLPTVAEPSAVSPPSPVELQTGDRDRDAKVSPSFDREREIARSEQLQQQGDLQAAASILRKCLVVDSGDVEVLFRLSTLQAQRGDLAGAVDLLDTISTDHPEAGIPALGQSADWCMQLQRYEEAQRRYQQVLALVPDAAPARRQLAFLLNRQGRRHEAAVHLRELCKLGDVRQDELHALIVLSHAMYDDPDAARGNPDEFIYAPIGPSGVARKLLTDREFSAAADAIEELVETGSAPPAVIALYGRAVAEAQDDRRLLWWLTKVNDSTRRFADYWAAVGAYLVSQRRFEEATRALLEAVDRDPTDMNSLGRLAQALLALGHDELSQRLQDRWDAMNKLVQANNRVSASDPPDPDQIAELAASLDQLGRPLEALLWRSLETHYRGTLRSEMSALNAQRQRLVATDSGFASRMERLANVDPDRFPLPKIDVEGIDASPPATTPNTETHPPAVPSFANVASQTRLNHMYQVAAGPQSEGFTIYQSLGGAVVALDFDQDGRSDLYFSQGGSGAPTFRGSQTNQLFRNVGRDGLDPDSDESVLVDTTIASGAVDYRYTIGATAGDWNQDGFPDLVVANIGDDCLMINNGDGTFTRRAIIAGDDANRVPSSVAMADLTGDHFPDIIELADVDDPQMILFPKRNETNEVINSLSPLQFEAGTDRLCTNDGRGGMTIKPLTMRTRDIRTSLGLVVTDMDDRPGNEVFVGNDLLPDQLWVREPSTGSWSDVAPALGCAFGVSGARTASMGIAAGDLDNSGTIDLHVTNFQNQNASLFLNLGTGFLERNVQYGLAADSLSVLGFGTQTLDYDNDGLLDLVVTNGHIEKALAIDAPLEQPAQLFCNLGGRFELIGVNDPSGYWDARHIGRGLARLDFNRDGRNDFVITHIGERSALLINRTQTPNHWLQLRLVGVASERDAIGAKIRIRYGNRQSTEWVIAGDGYLSRNEAIVSFGLGEVSDVDEIRITWPSGGRQTIHNVAGDQRLLIVENQPAPFTLGP